MLNIDLTFLWTAVNLVVLFLFLRKFLFGRVTQFMDQRAARIEADIQAAAEDKAAAAQSKAEYDALVQTAAAERARTLEASRQKAAAEYEATVAAAKAEAGRMVAQAAAEAEQEHARAKAQLRNEVASLALAAAGKVMEANMDSQKNRQLVDEFLDSVENGGAA